MIAKYRQELVVIFISLWALYLRFQRLAARELWNDEIYQLKQTVGPFKHIWGRNDYGDLSCFPGDYVLTYPFVRFFGDNKWGLAIPHILITIIGFYFLYLIGKRYFKTIWGFVVAFAVVCFNQYLIFQSFEFRPYAVLPTLALASFYLIDTVFTEYSFLGRWKKFFIGLFFILTIWFHAFGILIILFPLFFFFGCRRRMIEISKKILDIFFDI